MPSDIITRKGLADEESADLSISPRPILFMSSTGPRSLYIDLTQGRQLYRARWMLLLFV